MERGWNDSQVYGRLTLSDDDRNSVNYRARAIQETVTEYGSTTWSNELSNKTVINDLEGQDADNIHRAYDRLPPSGPPRPGPSPGSGASGGPSSPSSSVASPKRTMSISVR